jgi:rRNA maturation endonuclease Nob1
MAGAARRGGKQSVPLPLKQNCIVCGKQVEKDSKFCRHCGAVQEILCPGCGKVYKEMIKFCSECGSSLEAKEEPSNENA